MKPGGCDRTLELIGDWVKRNKDLFEDVTPSHKAGHVGTCVNSFDKHSGECTVSHLPYRDISHFASGLEGSKKVSKEHFLKHAAVPKHLEPTLHKKSTDFYHDKEHGVHMMHDTHKDVHHFFTEEYGAGFEGTKKLVRNYVKDTPGAVQTIKRIVKAKYKRKLL
jgi:hypothetical protein